jgi:hypothetical protein
LILPWVEVRHLASHVLALMTRQLSGHWQLVYGHPICSRPMILAVRG